MTRPYGSGYTTDMNSCVGVLAILCSSLPDCTNTRLKYEMIGVTENKLILFQLIKYIDHTTFRVESGHVLPYQ